MSSLEDLDGALKTASLSEGVVWDFILGNVVLASVENIGNPIDAKRLLGPPQRKENHEQAV